MRNAVVCTDVSFEWPDGTNVFAGLELVFSSGRTGLIGRNGSGKSTLLQLVAGLLTTTGGSVRVTGTLAYLPQQVGRHRGTVADLLGIAGKQVAPQPVDRSSGTPPKFDMTCEEWDIDTATKAALMKFGIQLGGSDPLGRPIDRLSSGEAVQIALAGCWLRHPDILLLDEPTDNLDRAARERLYDAIAGWTEVAVVVSHDRELLDLMDCTAEVRGGSVRTHIGNWSRNRELIATEQQGALGVPQISKVNNAADLIGDESRIRLELPDTEVSAGRAVLELHWRGATFVVRGPERIALIGPNGSGKTALLDQIVGRTTTFSPQIRNRTERLGYLPQCLDVLDDRLSVLDNVRTRQPRAAATAIRAGLGRFLRLGDRVDQVAGTLSGGERLRVSLAMLLLADPSPQLLLLDEPTSSLDLDTAEQLAAALAGYRGALIVASHDLPFVESIGIQRFWSIDTDGNVHDSVSPRR